MGLFLYRMLNLTMYNFVKYPPILSTIINSICGWMKRYLIYVITVYRCKQLVVDPANNGCLCRGTRLPNSNKIV